MKKTNCLLLFIFLLSINLIQAQEENKSKFNILAYGGIGYGIVDNDNEPNYNLNSNNGEILLNYNLNQKFGIATGIGLNELTGNGFNSIGNFYHERTMVKIPLIATMSSNISEKIRIVGNFGFYGQTIAKDEYRFLNNTQKDIYEGWNFGAQLGLGFVFNMFDNFNAGINYIGQSDFSKFESNNNVGINDKQKMKNLSSIGIILMIEL
jgi:opacity protein-like surface antigen